MRKFSERVTSISGFSLLEILSAILIAIVLAAILLSSLSKIRQQGDSARCVSNLRQIGVYFSEYSAENNGDLLPGLLRRVNAISGAIESLPWSRVLIADGYLSRNENWDKGAKTIFGCPVRAAPAWVASDQLHYGYSSFIGFDPNSDPTLGQSPKKNFAIAQPSKTMLLAEINSGYRFSPDNLSLTSGMTVIFPHKNRMNALYADGSVQQIFPPLKNAVYRGPSPQVPFY